VTVTPPFDDTLHQDDIALGSPRAVRMLGYLPPYYWDDPTVRGYVSAMAREFDRIEAAAVALRTGAFPSTADERTLEYYEAIFSLSNKALTLEARRADVVGHMRKRSVASRYDWQQALDAFINAPGNWSYAEAPPYTVNLTVPVDPTGDRTPVITAYARAVTPAHLLLVVNGNYGAFQIGISHIGVDPL
jgi:hypothetical protein